MENHRRCRSLIPVSRIHFAAPQSVNVTTPPPHLPPGEGSALVLKRCTGHRRLLISLEQAGVQNSRAGLLLDPKGVAMTVNPVRHPDSVNGAGLHHKFL